MPAPIALVPALETTAAGDARRTSQPAAWLRDNFTDNIVDEALWPNSFGTQAEVGGRARVACDSGYNAYSSAKSYRILNSAVAVRVYAPANGGAVTEAWAQVLLKSVVEGTDAGFEIRLTSNRLVMLNRLGYTDGTFVNVAYSPVDHAWLRLREASGTLYWETSPDGITWTVRRSETDPAWASDGHLEVQLICHRADGTPDYAEFDDVNYAPTARALTTAVEQTTARPLPRTKRRTLVPAIEQASAQPLTRRKVRQAVPAAATASARALTRRKTRAALPAADTSTARPLAASKTTPLTPASETNTPQPLGRTKTAGLPTAGHHDTAQALTGHKERPLAPAGETNQAQPLAPSTGLVPARETATAHPLTGHKVYALVPALETSSARPLSRTKRRALAPAGETETAQTLARRKSRALQAAHETSTARPLTPSTPEADEVTYEVGQAFTTWQARQPYATWETGQPW
ncbi:hypothetical protein [Streptomyces tauricus]